MDNENEGGAMVPIWALAYEHHEDPEMRPYDEPISDETREELVVGAAAAVMRMHRFFLKQRNLYTSPAGTFTHQGGKVGRNEPCPCGSERSSSSAVDGVPCSTDPFVNNVIRGG